MAGEDGDALPALTTVSRLPCALAINDLSALDDEGAGFQAVLTFSKDDLAQIVGEMS
jgi:hypothetical protein